MSDAVSIRCPHCDTTNRVPRAKLEQGLKAVCGRCKQPLPAAPAAAPLTVTDATFAAEVERSPLPVLVDAWAPWCGPCRMIAPTIDQVASELAGKAVIGKLNVDENPAVTGRYSIRGIPALLVFKGGQLVDSLAGAGHSKQHIKATLEKHL